MGKKAVDLRIPALIRNGVQEKKRSFFVVVGDRQKDVIVHLYHILSSVDIKINKSVLWAYKNKLLGFTSHRKKREKKIKKEIKRGTRDADTDDPFELFISSQNIRYVYYKETDKILGNTYGMCILQDFEAITPNLLARTIETVEGGGLVILLLKGMNSLKQLYTMSMDVHSRYRTEAYQDVVARFNERFILSLGSCGSCLVVDDELNVLPISGASQVKQLPPDSTAQTRSSANQELQQIKDSLVETQPIGSLITLARTTDQARALLTFVDTISEKTLQSTVTLTAGRGRGKSAALGVAIAAAISHGYSNIFITSPSPENLRTLFQFVFKGFDALNYLDHVDYSIIQSTNPAYNKAIVRVNVHRQHRQTIQYIQPQDAYALGQCELLVIDEAAAIPLPLVRKLIGPYLVFMASTINGYEGTGRSLSMKLIQQLRDQARANSSAIPTNGNNVKHGQLASASRTLREVTLAEPIRYAPGDAVEQWLNTLLCLDASLSGANLGARGCPHPSTCELLQVNRDKLFSFHPASEMFLQWMMALYVSSHYKNSPNDLQLMSDAPAHQLFVLVPPGAKELNRLPEPLCVIQVALEGQISKESVLQSLNRGQRAGGDLIPWLVSQQFQEESFAQLSGARIVRIATHPNYSQMGYGTKALQLLIEFFEGKFINLDEVSIPEEPALRRITDTDFEHSTLLEDNIKVREDSDMPPLFRQLHEIRPPRLDYMGVSYGLTTPLHKFWRRASFFPVYLRQTANDLTGEHTCVMLRALRGAEADTSFIGAFSRDFQRRFLALLSFQFRLFPSVLALTIDEGAMQGAKLDTTMHPVPLNKVDLYTRLSAFDLKRLDSYANNMIDYHVILDMLPCIAELYFTGRMSPTVKFSGVQSSILLAIGLQRKLVEDLEKELGLPVSQILAMFVKIVRKVTMFFRSLLEDAAAQELPQAVLRERFGDIPSSADNDMIKKFEPLTQGLSEELRQGAHEIWEEERSRARNMIDALPLDRYEMGAIDEDWEEPERQIRAKKGTVVSVRRDQAGQKRKAGEAMEEARREIETLGDSKKTRKSSKRGR